MSIDYKKKYLLYKQKYINLKKNNINQTGGGFLCSWFGWFCSDEEKIQIIARKKYEKKILTDEEKSFWNQQHEKKKNANREEYKSKGCSTNYTDKCKELDKKYLGPDIQ
jgi:hypothetical protein